MRTAKEWNTLLASMFPDLYNLDVFKTRVDRMTEHRRALVEVIGGGDLSPGHGTGRPGGVGSRHFLLRSTDAREGGGEARAEAAFLRATPPPPHEETPGTSDVAQQSPAAVGACLWAASSG